jgi:hypothetical protein
LPVKSLPYLLTISAALILSGCRTTQYGASWENLPREQAQTSVIRGDYQVSTSVAAMPPGLKDAFRRATRQPEFKLAEPAASTSAGERLRRLSFWGISPASAFVLYRNQDKIDVLVFQSEGGHFNFHWGGQSNSAPGNVDELKRQIAAGNFKDDLPFWW